MENDRNEPNLRGRSLADQDSPAKTPRQVKMVIFGNEAIPLEVRFVAPPSAESDEDDLMPPGLSEQEEAIFFRQSRAIRTRSVSSMFNLDHPNNRSVPKVEPFFKRQVFQQGTLITITLHQVRKEDVLVEVMGRTLMVTGVVRTSADFVEEGSTHPSMPGKKRKPRLIYTYKTGVTEMMDLTSIIAGYRTGFVDLFLRRMQHDHVEK